MEKTRVTTLRVEEIEKPAKSAFEQFLSTYSEIAFIYTAIPSFLLTFIGLLTGILLFVHKSQYDDCKNSDDSLFMFLLGQMIFYYSFLLIYANLLLQLIPLMNNLTVTFVLFVTYFFGNTAWSLWGIDSVVETGCSSSVYAGMASFNIAFTLLFDLALAVSFVVLVVIKRRSQPAVQAEVREKKFREQNSGIDDHGPPVIIGDNSGWKEENLDEF
jgi:hypothetical protein